MLLTYLHDYTYTTIAVVSKLISPLESCEKDFFKKFQSPRLDSIPIKMSGNGTKYIFTLSNYLQYTDKFGNYCFKASPSLSTTDFR